MGKYVSVIKANIVNMYRKGALSIIIGNFTTNFLTFFGSIVIVRIMSKSDFGVLSYIENLYGFIYILIGLGMKNAILRYVILADDIDAKYSRYCFSLRFGTLSNIVIIVIALFINAFYPHPQEYGNVALILSVYCFMLLPQFIAESNIVGYRAFLKNNAFAKISIILSACIIFSKIVGYSIYNIPGIVILLFFTYGCIAVLSTIHIKKNCFNGAHKIVVNNETKKEMERYSIQYMFTNGVWALFMLVDVFMISKLTGDMVAVAEYKVAHVLPGAMTILSSTIGIFITPYFVKNEKNIAWVKRQYKKLFICTALMIGMIVALLVAITKPLILLIYGEQYLDVINVMRVLFIAAFFNAGLRYTTANVLAAVGLVEYNLKVSVIGLIIQVILDYLFIPKYGIMGVAFSNIIVYAYMSIVLFIFFNRNYKNTNISIDDIKE